MTDPNSHSNGGDGIRASGNSTVKVTGNVEGGIGYGNYGHGGDGILARENAKIEVNGDVKGGSTNGKYGDAGVAILVECTMFDPDDKVKIVVNGLVESGKGEQSTTPIRTLFDEDESEGFIPEISIWKAGSTPIVSGNVDFDTQFIVKFNQPENGSISVDKEIAKAGEKVTITVRANDGYKVKRVLNGDTVLTANADGTYTVEVGENGGIDIHAEMEKLPNKDASPQTGDNGFGLALMMIILSLFGVCLSYFRFLRKSQTL